MKTRSKKILVSVLIIALVVHSQNVCAGGSQDDEESTGASSGTSSGSSIDEDVFDLGNMDGAGGVGGTGAGSANAEQSAKTTAEGCKTTAKSKTDTVKNTISGVIAKAKTICTNTYNGIMGKQKAIDKATRAGDPVLVTTGTYILEEEDFSLPLFSYSRVYVSEDVVKGSLGKYWKTSIDERLIRGTTTIDPSVLKEIQINIDDINVQLTMVSILASMYPSCSSVVNEIATYQREAVEMRNGLTSIAERGDLLHQLNLLSLFPDSSSSYEETGNDSIVLINESGTPYTFDYKGNGKWLPSDTSLAKTTSLESLDGIGAESTVGFVMHCKEGINKYFNRQGLLTAIEKRNGIRTNVIRDTSNGKVLYVEEKNKRYDFTYSNGLIKKINTPENKSIMYNYTNDVLTSITDIDGDTVGYEYTENRMTKIQKNDGSFISIIYGYTSSDGSKLVTETINEEGATERFDYFPDQKKTIHVNHSGVRTSYYYDQSHRTIRQEDADGSIKSSLYNTETDTLDAQNINGDTTLYTYDPRGNRNSARYSDGSTEIWNWNEYDQKTEYRDRDGVVTQWIYDSKGNCTKMYHGGKQVFEGSYDSKGCLVRGKTCEHSEETYTYDQNGFLAEKTVDNEGKIIVEKWTRDGLGRLTAYINGENQKTTIQYSGKSVIEISPTQLEKTYIYNSRKDLVKLIEMDKATGEKRERTIQYDKRHLPVKITDGEGKETLYTYRSDGKLVTETKGLWKRLYSYNDAGDLKSITHSRQKEDGTFESSSESFSYARNYTGEIITTSRGDSDITDITNTYQYDSWNRVSLITNSLDEKSIREVSAQGRLKREQTASGGFLIYDYDATGQLERIGKEGEKYIAVMYNTDGSIKTKTDRNNLTTEYMYDGCGLLSSENSPEGKVQYTYDLSGRITKKQTFSANYNHPGDGVFTTVWNYSQDGRKVTVTEGSLYTTVWTLNAWGEVIKKTDGENNSTSWIYNPTGNIKEKIDAYENKTEYTWNTLDKIERITFPDGTAIIYSYNENAQVTKITDSLGTQWEGSYDSAGRLVHEKGRPGIDKTYTYDRLNRITEIQSGGERIESYQYDNRGRTVISIDGNGNKYTYQKDAFALLTEENNRLGMSQHFSYNEEDQISEKNQFSKKSVHTEYNEREGTTSTTYSDGSNTVIKKDAVGHIIQASGVTGSIYFTYNEGGRLVYQFDEKAGEETFYSYDKVGRKIKMKSGNREVSYQYGKNGELLSVADNKQRLFVSFVYDVMGREKIRTFGNGVSQETKYDSCGRTIMIRELSDSDTLIRGEGYLYDAEGRRSRTVDEKGNVTFYQYDNQSRLSVIGYPYTTEKAIAARDECEQAGLFIAPSSGKSERIMIPSHISIQLRELLNQMSPARGSILGIAQTNWIEKYTYDKNGNRVTKTTPWGTINYQYDNENRLISMGDTQFTYDADGNLISEKSLRKVALYEYTDFNRMKNSVVINTIDKTRISSAYVYDAFGRRTVVQDTGGETMRTLYDGLSFDIIRESVVFNDGSFTSNFSSELSLSTETDAENSRYRWIDETTEDNRSRSTGIKDFETAKYRFSGIKIPLYANGESIAMNRSSSESSTAYLGTDLLGSVRSITNEYGRLDERYEYDAFGKPYKGNFSTGLDNGYTGKPYDSITGMYNYGYRDFVPEIARFTTVDPICDGNNWFAYVNNDPVNYVDEWGLSASDKNSAADARKMEAVADAQNKIEKQTPTDSSKTHCDINSWNQAIDQGYDPRPSTGGNPDFNTMTVAEIYPLYSDSATNHPTNNTGGYGFYDDDNNNSPNHIFTYEYQSGNTYQVWDSPGVTDQTEKTWTVDGSADDHSTFVPLNSLP